MNGARPFAEGLEPRHEIDAAVKIHDLPFRGSRQKADRRVATGAGPTVGVRDAVYRLPRTLVAPVSRSHKREPNAINGFVFGRKSTDRPVVGLLHSINKQRVSLNVLHVRSLRIIHHALSSRAVCRSVSRFRKQ